MPCCVCWPAKNGILGLTRPFLVRNWISSLHIRRMACNAGVWWRWGLTH
jgi:hypothetical protein